MHIHVFSLTLYWLPWYQGMWGVWEQAYLFLEFSVFLLQSFLFLCEWTWKHHHDGNSYKTDNYINTWQRKHVQIK